MKLGRKKRRRNGEKNVPKRRSKRVRIKFKWAPRKFKDRDYGSSHDDQGSRSSKIINPGQLDRLRTFLASTILCIEAPPAKEDHGDRD